jgi:starch-binding outer membrane protein, SusD/RagB family
MRSRIDLARIRRSMGRLTRPFSILLAAAMLPLGACSTDKLLEVEDPDVVTPGSLNDKSALPALLGGTQSEFQVAMVGNNGGDSQITLSATLSDELHDVDTFPTRVEVDQRNIQSNNTTMLAPYRSLHQARAAAEKGAAAYARLNPNVAEQSELLSIAGLVYIVFGENYCSGVPFSSTDDAGNLVYGAPQTTQQLFQAAVAKFDSALAVATTAANTARLNLARVGKGRALLNLGQFTAARDAVASVPTAFAYRIETSESSGRQNNSIYRLTSGVDPRYSGWKNEGVNGLNFQDLDPRAKAIRVNNSNGQDNSNPIYFQQKYLSRSAPVSVADGIEARLIEAEAALQADDAATLLTKLNELRATRTDLPAFTAADIPATKDARATLLFRERAYWMWLTNHRLGDLRRLVRQYGRAINSVYPTGNYESAIAKGGGRYFDDVNFPIPVEELNNPSFPGCINRNP